MAGKNVKYHAYEIDKYAIKIAMSNYPVKSEKKRSLYYENNTSLFDAGS